MVSGGHPDGGRSSARPTDCPADDSSPAPAYNSYRRGSGVQGESHGTCRPGRGHGVRRRAFPASIPAVALGGHDGLSGRRSGGRPGRDPGLGDERRRHRIGDRKAPGGRMRRDGFRPGACGHHLVDRVRRREAQSPGHQRHRQRSRRGGGRGSWSGTGASGHQANRPRRPSCDPPRSGRRRRRTGPCDRRAWCRPFGDRVGSNRFDRVRRAIPPHVCDRHGTADRRRSIASGPSCLPPESGNRRRLVRG